MHKFVFVFVSGAALFFGGASAQGNCEDVTIPDRIDCGFFGIDETQCVAQDCCWVPVAETEGHTRDTPWCFFKSDVTRPPSECDDLIWTSDDPGFSDVDYELIYQLYRNNLNVEGSGAVVAAPDTETPGGSYYYHWMRDAGLSIKAWLDINDNDLATVRAELDPYLGWVGVVQNKPDENVDVRVEPKFEIPSGDPYTGGWCRPQTDGPALRAMALSKYGMILNTAGEDTSDVWTKVQFDLEWVLANWDSEGCDLWEEVRSDDFYFNRMAYVYSLNVAADFADAIGEDGAAYRALADEVRTATEGHYTDGFIYESTSRQIDGAVIHSIATFGEFLYPPESTEAAETIAVVARTFCEEYPINGEETAAGVPGLLIGRYPGDSYGGGNPWQLLTAVFAEVFYLGGTANLKSVREKGEDFALDFGENRAWLELMGLREGATAGELALRQMEAGDAVMYRLWTHVNSDAGRVDEQIDKFTGVQTSAEGLTWSYANILHALWTRRNVVALRGEVLGY